MTIIFKRTLMLCILAGVSSVIAERAQAAAPCEGVKTSVTTLRRNDYARLVAESLNNNVNPAKVKVTKFMEAETWSVVYAFAPGAEPGYFFFESSTGRPRFKDVWGGVAQKSETPEIFRWATRLGANKALAACFADTVTR